MSDDKYREAFQQFDEDGNGAISSDELRTALRSAFGEMDDSEMENLLAMKGDKECLDVDEFVAFMQSVEASRSE
ncbi:hypothetical protein BOX15_Mlig009526g1 [Macrostomum lignano]|uniref:EF-hand domain-containing protein n=1 Tax=Macrostomum lignano TaxID=282301 RepID=A0A267GXU4_9PLAT|nr:hypothetical protein BOX15_Mlig009526g1 [Macrostomum lignano]